MVEYCRSVLKQIAVVIDSLSTQEYSLSQQQQSSVGAHIRHILDHFIAVTKALDSGVVDYSHRSRGSLIEHCADTAIATIIDLDNTLAEQFCPTVCEKRIKLIPETADLLTDQDFLYSNIQRELMFIASHAVHHLALIKMRFPTDHPIQQIEYLGYAPATIQALKSSALQE
ncbi:hypothetical protein ACMZOO_04470 [Catenovulum sp. SX2]|uniref:hypothetical protein n=1 Tax=Catenovulum sp. SX2 TaxID=3398614 RepID=UPI003F844175